MILLSISILAIIISSIIYRRQPLELALRLAAIVFMYLLITNHALRFTTDTPLTKPVVLVDHSKSMAHSLQRSLHAVSKIDFPHELFFFNESLLTSAEPEHPGSYTDISRALLEANKMDPSVLLLITDGNHNFGASPLTILDEITTPVYVYGAGEDRLRDISITTVEAPRYAYPGDSIHVEVIVESSGFSAGSGQATLNLSSGKTLARQTFSLSDIPARNRMDFWLVPREPGLTHLNVKIEPVTNEISYDNNKYAFSLNVLKEKIRVLYYTDHVSFNTKFILEALFSDVSLTVSSMVTQGPGKQKRAQKPNGNIALPGIKEHDVIILDNVNIGKIPWLSLPELLERGQGIMLTGLIEGIDEQWRNIMPINTTGGLVAGTHKIQITEPFSVLTGGDYPPVRSVSRIIGSKQDATIVAKIDNLPVIGFRQHGKARVFQICIGDLGVWSFLRQGLKDKDLLGNLLGDIVRFISPLGTQPRLVLDTKPREYQIGETVQLTLQSYDRNFRNAGGGDFFLHAGDTKTPFYETRQGIYEANMILQKTGRHSMTAQGELDGETLTSNTIEVKVSPRSDESEHRLNRVLLENIAARTNGRFFMVEELSRITPPKSERRKVSKVINLNSPVTYFMVLIMLAIDWILRRRRGIT